MGDIANRVLIGHTRFDPVINGCIMRYGLFLILVLVCSVLWLSLSITGFDDESAVREDGMIEDQKTGTPHWLKTWEARSPVQSKAARTKKTLVETGMNTKVVTAPKQRTWKDRWKERER